MAERVLSFWLAIAFLLGASGAAGAQMSIPASSSDDLKARVERLEKQNQDLVQIIQKLQPLPASALTASAPSSKSGVTPEEVKKIVGSYLAEQDDLRKVEADQKVHEGLVVGDDRKLNATWDAGGLRFRSADGAFSLHIGGRLMTDQVWWTQSPGLRASATQPAGSPLGLISGVGPGIGDLQDGFFIRRARVVADGNIFKTVEYKVEFDFENYNNLLFDESYVGVKNLPFVDTVRVGQTHCPFGLEAYTSSRYLPMLERSPLFDAFYQEFAPGIFMDTTFLDQRITTQHMFHKIDNFSQFNGASFGDGKYAYSGRISGLPLYEDAGRELLHLGFAYQWRKGSTPADFRGGTALPSVPSAALTQNSDLFRFLARPGLRDGVGLQGLQPRVVDTGNIIAEDVQSLNAELLWYMGPFWVQSEACLAHVDHAFFPAAANAVGRGNLNYWGTYVQAGYFLTGDNRGYDKRMGKYERVVPLENFFLVRDENGRIQHGLGAWEVVYRYSFLDLNDAALQGGLYSEHTVGLNWYWNSNIKIQCNYINGQRTAPAGAASGNVQGFGLRAALEF
jgi:phosphate-selective porin OprO and OprP